MFANFPQGTKSFESRSKEISNTAGQIDQFRRLRLETGCGRFHDGYKRQVPNSMRAVQDNANYKDLLKLGIAKEQSQKGVVLLEKASGQDPLLMSRATEEVCRLQLEKKLCSRKPTQPCFCCGSETNRQTCHAVGKQCANAPK